jgi:hypothetical protein
LIIRPTLSPGLGDGSVVFRYTCKRKLEDDLSKRKDLGYRSGPDQHASGVGLRTQQIMSEIIETMARADVDYFWRQGGNRFENFEKPVAEGVRKRMEGIVAALETAGFNIRGPASWTDPERPAEAVREIAEQALNDAIEITRLIALMRGQNANGINKQLEKSGAGKAASVLKNALLARFQPGLPRSSKVEVAKIAKPTGSKLVKGPAESEKFVRWKSMKNSEENS